MLISIKHLFNMRSLDFLDICTTVTTMLCTVDCKQSQNTPLTTKFVSKY